MRLAAQTLKDHTGGMCICMEGEVLDSLQLEVGGLMTDAPLMEVVERIEDMNRLAIDMGVNKNIEPFMTLAFLALPVIPELKLTDKGLFDVTKFSLVDINA